MLQGQMWCETLSLLYQYEIKSCKSSACGKMFIAVYCIVVGNVAPNSSDKLYLPPHAISYTSYSPQFPSDLRRTFRAQLCSFSHSPSIPNDDLFSPCFAQIMHDSLKELQTIRLRKEDLVLSSERASLHQSSFTSGWLAKD